MDLDVFLEKGCFAVRCQAVDIVYNVDEYIDAMISFDPSLCCQIRGGSDDTNIVQVDDASGKGIRRGIL